MITRDLFPFSWHNIINSRKGHLTMKDNYDDLFPLQHELEKLREDETDDFTRIKELIRSGALDFGIQRDFKEKFQKERNSY